MAIHKNIEQEFNGIYTRLKKEFITYSIKHINHKKIGKDICPTRLKDLFLHLNYLDNLKDSRATYLRVNNFDKINNLINNK